MNWILECLRFLSNPISLQIAAAARERLRVIRGGTGPGVDSGSDASASLEWNYDDTEFYRTLLSEFLERRAIGAEGKSSDGCLFFPSVSCSLRKPPENALDTVWPIRIQFVRCFLYISGASAGSGNSGLVTRPSKRRKAVDRRASKGRKLRYTPQIPLANFMAPVPLHVPASTLQLFSDLFGGKTL